MLNVIFSPKANMAISLAMLIAGLFLAIGNWPLNIIGKEEPRLIYQMSAMALWFSAYSSILVSVVRHENKSDDGS